MLDPNPGFIDPFTPLLLRGKRSPVKARLITPLSLLAAFLFVILVAVSTPAQKDDPSARKADAKPEPRQPRRISLDDLGKLVGVSDPQIAPDGKSIVIVVCRANVDRDRFDHELVLV